MADEHKQEKDMKKEYEAAAKKHGLPSYDDLDREFPLGHLEPGEYVLRSICVKLAERCEYTRKMLGDLIQPESHIADMQEAEGLSDSDKSAVMDLFKKLSYYSREFVIRDFEYDEKKSAEMIKQFAAEWEKIRPTVVKIMARIRDNWKESLVKKSEYSYFG